MLAKIVDGNLITDIPDVFLRGDIWISNYNCLDTDELKLDGWKEAVEIKPAYDEATEYLVLGSFEEKENEILINYIVENISRGEANE